MVFQSVAFYFRCFFTQDHVEDERGSAAGDCYSASEASWPFEVASAVYLSMSICGVSDV